MNDVLILGGGLCGMSAAAALGERATVLEREARPGGLVRAECFEGYWFDHVLHLLHLQDRELETTLRELLGDALVRCPPEAWVETSAGTARFPLQMHLGHLDSPVVARILDELRALDAEPDPSPATNYAELLERSFGETLYGLFFEPYNRKMWKRELSTLGHAGQTWNLHRPDLEQVLSGAREPDRPRDAYNSYAFYPQPPPNAPVRGMEVLSRALATRVSDLRLGHEIVRVRPATQSVVCRVGDQLRTVTWGEACLSTLPLTQAMALCEGVPRELQDAIARLRHNLVVSVGVRVRGPRPELGHWRYYADPALSFTRLVFLHAFDPLLAPADGWPLLAEVTWPAGRPLDTDDLVARVEADVRRLGLVPPGSEILGSHVMVANPAYVVFGLDERAVVDSARGWLRERGIHTRGRYGAWQYSSMAGVMIEGRDWAVELDAGTAD